MSDEYVDRVLDHYAQRYAQFRAIERAALVWMKTTATVTSEACGEFERALKLNDRARDEAAQEAIGYMEFSERERGEARGR